jgi:ATP-dependent RNA helicase RhlE
MNKFKELHLKDSILTNITKAGFETPTPIQTKSIPLILKKVDLLGIAQTGTGKTAAFGLPIIQLLTDKPRIHPGREPRVLILSPTRELSSQIYDNLKLYSQNLSLRLGLVFGGVGQAKQVNTLREGVDILVATPGRLLDLMNQGFINLTKIEIFVLDEADRMLDMGFINDVKKITAKIPRERQTLFFSATMPKEIARLAETILRKPERVEITPESTTVEKINQKIIRCRKAAKYQLLRVLLGKDHLSLVLVFSRTKHGANRIVDYLAHFKIAAAAIHGNKSQNAREYALNQFRAGQIKVLIATDLAARGIDVPDISHVINFDLPVESETYVHRIGRTARAGKSGEAISFCDETENDALKRIERTIGMKLPVEEFQGIPEASVRISKPQKPYRDPRRPSSNKNNQNSSRDQKRPKVGFKFRSSKNRS